jgi:small subunit ribosomal protein S1
LADHKVDNPEEIVKVGQEIEVRVLRVDSAERKIGLSRRVPGSEGEAPAGGGDEAARGTAVPREELKGGTGSGSAGPLFTMGGGPADGDSEESSAP